MCDYVDYPRKYGHGFAVLCSIFAVSRILADSCDFFTYIILCCFVGGVGYTKNGIFPTFSPQISNKKHFTFVSFSCGLMQITSKPSEANSGTYGNIYQGFILNLGLNCMQYAFFTSNQSKNMWFTPLIRNMNCAITYMHVHKKLSCSWQVHQWFKGKYFGANHPCVCITAACPKNWQRGWQVFTGSLFTHC